MKDMPLISIIVPVYGVEQYLDFCMKSLTDQSYQNLVILLIDDGSPDRCPMMCDIWAEKDSRVRVLHTDNHGVSHARNMGLNIAKGDYIGFVDPDDWVDLDLYENMIEYIKQTGADIHEGGCVFEELTGKQTALTTGKACVLSFNQAIIEMFSVKKNSFLTWSLCDKLFSRQAIGDLRLDESLKRSEDQWFLWQIMRKMNFYSYAPQLGYHYRMREGSAIHTPPKLSDGTYIDAMQRILDDAGNLGRDIQFTLKIKYSQISLGVLKNILIAGNHDFDDLLKHEQKKIRGNFFVCLQQPGISKWGIIFLSLPTSIVWKLRPLLIKLKGKKGNG